MATKTPSLESRLERILGEKVASAEPIGGGRNSPVYLLTAPDGQMRVAKMYVAPGEGERDRMEAEFAGLSFLCDQGERAVPQPLAIHRDHRCVVFQYVDGALMPPASLTDSDIDQAVAFAVRITALTKAQGSASISPASEACFSVQAILDNIQVRRTRLADAASSHPDLAEFLKEQFDPVLKRTSGWCQTAATCLGLSFDEDLSHDQLTLSPSDFGFHNALKKPDGSVVFMDFEHFGWDDPAKMVSDFLLHPAMELAEDLKARFVGGVVSGLAGCAQLEDRVKVVYPLFGLKWCMILLNEFRPDQLARRGFASAEELDLAQLQAEQLLKAKRMLNKVKHEYDRFPYRN